MLSIRREEITDYEKRLDFPAIVESTEPSVMSLRKQDYDTLFNYATSCALNFLSMCYPNQLPLAPVMASDLIETRPIWKAADFINLFKFLRQRQDLKELNVMGNTLTIPKFMEMVAVYEEHRSAALEQLHQKKKQLDHEPRISDGDGSIKSVMFKEMEQVRTSGKEVKRYTGKSDETFFEKK